METHSDVVILQLAQAVRNFIKREAIKLSISDEPNVRELELKILNLLLSARVNFLSAPSHLAAVGENAT